MKLITLNTHSLIEEHYEEKLHAFAEMVRKEKPDILALQEVNQLACEEIWPDEELPGFVRCRGFLLPVRRGNHAGRLAELLKDSGLSYSVKGAVVSGTTYAANDIVFGCLQLIAHRGYGPASDQPIL